ncbi:MAG: hypothetical protein CL878_07445 [Dehalococcoidia bacterium]|nr:hypothetical protein [Dehalococcoidia bacterium]
MAADVVWFDPQPLFDTAIHERPRSYAVGMPFVMVIRVLAKAQDQKTGCPPRMAPRRVHGE